MTRASTRSGVLQGFDDRGILTFLGVPYAAPVTTGRRFGLPQPVRPWAGTRRADAVSAVCPQVPTYGPVGHGATSRLSAGTDFLTVNVRTPSTTGSAPVLVWIHGGGYAVGSANETRLQSGAFARAGLVEVTVNYRLGVLGFGHVAGAPDNRGLLDQIAALQWVRENISDFGGDPERITFAGRSAGGFSVATIMAMPAARGLFARALVQSGATPAVLDPLSADRVMRRFYDAAGLRARDLEDAPIELLLTAQRQICTESYDHHDLDRDGPVTTVGIPFQPVVEGDSLPLHPEVAAARGTATPVPLVIGSTSSEYLTHATVHPDDLTAEDAAVLLHPRVQPLGLTGTEIVRRYARALPEHTGLGLWRAIGGDLVFQMPTLRFANAHSRHQVVHKYLYGAIEPDERGAAHGAEVAAVWQANSNVPFARQVHETWVSFIRDDLLRTPAGGPWPHFGTHQPDLVHLVSGEEGTVRRDPFFDRLSLWDRIGKPARP